MRRLVLTAAALVLVAAVSWAQAEFTEVNGKVEIRLAGRTAWAPAEVGMRIGNNTMISTGFNASAALRMGASTVRVEQLTRMEFEEIVEQSDAVQTRLSLNVGRMSAQVRSVDERRQDFRVRSPISTAAVRGTSFSFDGERLEVEEGQVAFFNQNNQQRSVGAGQSSTTTGDDSPSSPSDQAGDDSSVDITPVGAGGGDEEEGGDEGDDTGGGEQSSRGSVTVEVN